MLVPNDYKVWMYWENPPHGSRAAYLDLCHRTLHRQLAGLNLELIDRANVFGWLPDLDRAMWDSLPTPVYRSDYARTRLLHRYGGVWIDFDCIVMVPIPRLLEPLANADVVGWGREADGRFYNGLFAARPGSDFLTRWIEAQDTTIRTTADLRGLSWSALGQDITWPLARELSYEAWPIRSIAPVMWFEWRRFLSKTESPERVLALNPMTIMLWNSSMGGVVGGLTEQQLLSGRTLLSRLFRVALGTSTLSEELDLWTRVHLISELRFSTMGRRIERALRRTPLLSAD